MTEKSEEGKNLPPKTNNNPDPYRPNPKGRRTGQKGLDTTKIEEL